MKVIDLHGVRYRDVYQMLESSCVKGEIPFVVITGNSSQMKRIVTEIVRTFDLITREQMGNAGRLVIYESR